MDVQSKYVFTCDEGMRGGRTIALKKCVDDALSDPKCAFVEQVFLFKRTGTANIKLVEGRDEWMEPLMETQRPYSPPESMDAEDTLFYLYTSGKRSN